MNQNKKQKGYFNFTLKFDRRGPCHGQVFTKGATAEERKAYAEKSLKRSFPSLESIRLYRFYFVN